MLGPTGSFATLESTEVFPGVHRKGFNTEAATINRYKFAPHASFPLHSHPQEQITLVESGAVEMTISGVVARLGPGDWSVAEGGSEHGITASEHGAVFLTVLTPRRDDPTDYHLADPNES